MRKGTKSNFISTLEREVSTLWQEEQALPDSHIRTTYIVDAMAFVQRFRHMGANTFDELQKKYLKKLLEMKPQNTQCIHFVGDRYDFEAEKAEVPDLS